MSGAILFLCHNHVDYLQDGLFHGLASLLGKSRVIDWPRQERFHVQTAGPQPRLGFSPQPEPSRPRSRWRLRRELREGRFGLVVVAASRRGAFRAWHAVMDAAKAVPVVLVDGGDMVELAGQLAWESRLALRKAVLAKRDFDLVFKREHRGTLTNHPDVVPISFCLPEDYFVTPTEPISKTRQVAFRGNETSASRSQAIRMLRGVRDFAAAGGCDPVPGVRGQEYLRELAATKVCLSFWGAGDDTLRYWEIACVGSLLLAQRPRMPVPDNFIDRKEAVFVQDDLTDLVELLNYYCDHDAEREAIAAAGRAKFLRCHTTSARARYFLNRLAGRKLFPAVD